MNHFWSNLYAKLYKFLIIDYDFMKDICIENFNNYLDIFDDVEVDPEDYDALCKYNKANENRKGISSFFVNMMIFIKRHSKSFFSSLFN